MRRAFLFAASTGFSGFSSLNGAVTLDGAPVQWTDTDTLSSSIGSFNVAADVTALVKPKVDAAAAGGSRSR